MWFNHGLDDVILLAIFCNSERNTNTVQTHIWFDQSVWNLCKESFGSWTATFNG